MATSSPSNSLGLNFDALQIQNLPSAVPDSTEDPNIQGAADSRLPEATGDNSALEPQPKQDQNVSDTKEKKRPYINPERVKTGGSQRDKLSEEALTERMARMREQNEKIKQRRMDVKADEDAFKKTQEVERAKLAQIKKVQESVDRTREQNAKRKMDKVQSREWDSGKPAADWKNKPQVAPREPSKDDAPSVAESSGDGGGWVRGGGGGGRGGSFRGRGRGRGRGGFDNTGVTPKAEGAAEGAS